MMCIQIHWQLQCDYTGALTFISLSNSFITNLSRDKSVYHLNQMVHSAFFFTPRSNVRFFSLLLLKKRDIRRESVNEILILLSIGGMWVVFLLLSFCFVTNEKYTRVSVCNAILLMMRSHMQMRVRSVVYA